MKMGVFTHGIRYIIWIQTAKCMYTMNLTEMSSFWEHNDDVTW